MDSRQGRGPGAHYGWVVLAVSVLSAFAVYGSRFSIGLFLPPMHRLEGWSIGSLAVVLAAANLLSGLVQPYIGALADRFGAPRILAAGMAAQAAGLLLAGLATQLWHLYLALGLLLGVGAAAASMVVTATLINRWFEARRGLALGSIQTGLNLGQIVVVSGAGLILAAMGWRVAFFAVGLVVAAAVPAVLLFARPSPEEMGLLPYGRRPGASAAEGAPGASVFLDVAVSPWRHLTFRRLVNSLFCCGFLMSMIYTHYPNFAQSLGATPAASAAMLAIMGGTAGLGGLVAGALSDRFGGRRVLSAIYALRAVMTLGLVAVPTLPVLYAYALVFGLFASGTVPLTAGLTADFFGPARVGRLFGWVFLSHQVGVALGGTLAGWSFDYLGSYGPALAFGAAVSLAGALISWSLDEPRRLPATAAAAAVSPVGHD